jgi:putative endonuclease
MAYERQPAVYILASRHKGTLYVGVTSDLVRRVWLHRQNLPEGFTSRYGVHRLVFFEMHVAMDEAIKREKQLKWWSRAWKVRLIEEHNPDWKDLWPDLCAER